MQRMNVFLDTEFLDNGKTIDLISIGMVRDDGKTYYAQSSECWVIRADDWIHENVLAHLSRCSYTPRAFTLRREYVRHRYTGKCDECAYEPFKVCPWRTREHIRDEIADFLSDISPVFWGWITAYDWVVFCQLWGRMLDIPDTYPHYMRDIQYILDRCNIADEQVPAQDGQVHNALADAWHVHAIYHWLEEEYHSHV